MMQLTPAIYRNAPYYFGVFTLIFFAGFWVYYVDPIGRRGSQSLVHLHAFTMALWCLMLISQAAFIRMNRRPIHRIVGRSSLILVPVIVLLQISLIPGFEARQGNIGPDGITDNGAFGISSILGNAVVFAVLYVLAIVNRRDPPIHARYMLCTVLPILGPATDRIIFRDNPWIEQYLPLNPFGNPWESAVAVGIADFTVLALAVWDWQSHRRLNVFPLVLLLLVSHQVFVWFSYRIPGWRDFCDWFVGA